MARLHQGLGEEMESCKWIVGHLIVVAFARCLVVVLAGKDLKKAVWMS